MDPKLIATFLINRIYLIDIIKERNKVTFMIEEKYENYEVKIDKHFINCSCIVFNNKLYVCRHIKFILEKINDFTDKKSKSYNEIGTCDKLFDIRINCIEPMNFLNDRNPRYQEYRILKDTDYSGNCYICLEKLSKKIIRCKNCNKYYHEKCINGWLRLGSRCTCPNCRNQWI